MVTTNYTGLCIVGLYAVRPLPGVVIDAQSESKTDITVGSQESKPAGISHTQYYIIFFSFVSNIDCRSRLNRLQYSDEKIAF